MHVERHLVEAAGVFTRHQTELDSFIIESVTGIHLKGLFRHVSRFDADGESVPSDRIAIHFQDCAVRVARVVKIEVQCRVNVFRTLALVGQIKFEAGWLSVRHTAHTLLVHPDFRVLDFLRRHVKHLAVSVE